MKPHYSSNASRILSRGILVCLLAASLPCQAQELDENCVVSILNRTARVQADGTWRIDNVPATFEKARVRVTCVRDGVTTSGQSDFITFEPGIVNGFSPVGLGLFDPIPDRLEIGMANLPITAAGQTRQCVVTAFFPDGTTTDVSTSNSGINYRSSNPALASVDAEGVVTAHLSGTVLISAMLEGALSMKSVQVVLSGDKDGDGIADDLELANALNPCDPVDGVEDADEDGLTNKLELVDYGTNLRLADTDADGIRDGEEIVAGTDGFITSALLADTDGDLVRDALEIQMGTNPTSAASVNLGGAITTFTVTPASMVLTVNSVVSEASRQLEVTATLLDSTTVDLTSTSRGTNYTSSDLTIANFGSPDGRVFAGNNGSATVTVRNGTFTRTVAVTVNGFDPTPLGFVSIPGYANNVDVNNDQTAYVAAGSAGLQVVNVTDPRAPVIIGSLDTPGTAIDVRVVGTTVFIADGSAGLQIINAANPAAPVLLGTLDTPGDAQDVKVAGNIAYVADGVAGGLQIIDVSTPTAPVRLGSLDTEGNALGVDVVGTLAVVAEETPFPGLRIINVADPRTPVLVGSITMTGGPKDVDVEGDKAYVAAYSSGFSVVDLSVPSNPRVIGTIPGSGAGFVPRDVEVSDRFALAAEQLFADMVSPIVDISDPASPVFRANLTFPTATFGDYAGTGIALTREFAYLTAESFVVSTDYGTNGTTRLFIGQYRSIEDTEGRAPNVSILSPDGSAPFIQGEIVRVTADATDDVGVAAVDLLVGDTVVGSDSAPPYEFSLPLAADATSVTIRVRATDFGANSALSTPLTLQAIPDPGTRIIGTVVDPEGFAVPGASVSVYGSVVATTGPAGTFTVNNVATVRGLISASASVLIAGETLTGASARVAPVRGGTTDLGRIVLSRARYENAIGSALQSCDDCYEQVQLPFTFRYFGVNYTSLWMDGNGRLMFNSGNGAYTENLSGFTSQPTISVFWDDLDGRGIEGGGFYYNSSIPGRAVFTWHNVKEYAESSNELNQPQIILFEDGRIQFGYDGMTAPDAIVGITPGSAAPQVAVDFSEQTDWNWDVPTTVYQQFTNAFDLDRQFLVWTPNAGGGYALRRIATDGGTTPGVIKPVITIFALPNSDIHLTFPSQAGVNYRIQHSDNLGAWTTIPGILNGTGLPLTWTDNGPPLTPSHPSTVLRRYYRVLVP